MENSETGTAVSAFGRDHWSTFGYVEVRIVDHKGVIRNANMRCDPKRHPFFAHEGSQGGTPPTRLHNGVELKDHDDWDCLEDFEREGFLENIGTGVNPIFKLTDKGYELANSLRKHRAEGGSWSTFKLKSPT